MEDSAVKVASMSVMGHQQASLPLHRSKIQVSPLISPLSLLSHFLLCNYAFFCPSTNPTLSFSVKLLLSFIPFYPLTLMIEANLLVECGHPVHSYSCIASKSSKHVKFDRPPTGNPGIRACNCKYKKLSYHRGSMLVTKCFLQHLFYFIYTCRVRTA